VILSRLDLMACVKELGGLESTPQTNFVEKAGGGVEKTVQPPTPPTTKSLTNSYVHYRKSGQMLFQNPDTINDK